MFIRRTQTRATKTGRRYFTYRLVRGERVGARVRQVTLLNLGSDFAVPRAEWRLLVRLVEASLDGAEPLFAFRPSLRAAAEEIARRLRLRDARPEDGSAASVHLDSLRHDEVRSVGGERIALAALEHLRLPRTLRAVGASDREARLATALVVARMLHPSSEREALRWLSERSATFELLGLDGGAPVRLNQLYRIGDLLWRKRAEIEDALFVRERALFPPTESIVFFDLTNSHFRGRPSSPLARHGRSKQRRDDCPLVTLALSLDANGFPRRSEVLPGNVGEAKTLAAAIRRLEAQPGDPDAAKPTVVMDAGIVSEDNLRWLRERGYPWITVRPGGAPPPTQAADAAFATRVGDLAKVWRLEEEGGETHLCVWSAERQRKDDAFLTRQREAFEEALRSLHDGLSKPNHVKRFEKVLERLGRIRERHARVNRQYDIVVEPGEKGRAAAVSWRRNDRFARRDAKAGTYVLRTSHKEWSLEAIVRTYWRLGDLEATFRSLKGDVGLRPIWHQRTARIGAHLFIAVLAYHAVHLVRLRLAAQGGRDSWETIRNHLSGWVRLTSTLHGVDGARHVIRQDADPTAAARAVARAIGVEIGPKRVRTKERVAT